MKSLRIQGAGFWPWLALLAAGVLAGDRLGAAIVAVTGIAGVLALAAALAPGRRPQVALRRILPQSPRTAGDDIEVRLEGTLDLAWPLVLAKLDDEAPQSLQAGDGSWRLGGALHAEYRLRSVPRGLYRFRRCHLSLRDGLGLMQRQLTIDLKDDLLVYPQRVLVPLADWPAQQCGEEVVVRGTRDFLPGDRPTRLHAARTAQRGYPQVRESTPPPARARSLQLFCPGAARQDVELVISVAASLAESLLAAGFDVGLCLEGLSLPPGRGGEHLARLLAVLADAAPGRLSAAQLPPPLPEAYGAAWLIAGGQAALRTEPTTAAVLLRVGEDLADPQAIRSLADLTPWSARFRA